MEQGLWQKLRRVRMRDIGSIFLFFLAWPVALVYKRFRRDLWLICDTENEARDNGYWLFRYIRKKHPEQDVAYAINKRSPDYARVRRLGEVVQFGSFRHWVYYLAASKNISSQKDGKPDAAVCYVLEVYGLLKNTRVFLQHGITKDDAECFHYRNTRMRLFVCAAKRELAYVTERFGYPKGWVRLLGLCRFDNLRDASMGKRQLLVMPTWRSWIDGPTGAGWHGDTGDFRDTAYYKAWNGLLRDEGLRALLEREDVTLCFYPHRRMQKFLRYFDFSNPRIVPAAWPGHDVQTLLKESALLVTDYSSIAMDFAYMGKPLLYYQFDYGMFRKGHLAEGYFDYREDGFGSVCTGQEELIRCIGEIIEGGWRMPEEYRERADAFFAFHDRKNCERNYDAIRAL